MIVSECFKMLVLLTLLNEIKVIAATDQVVASGVTITACGQSSSGWDGNCEAVYESGGNGGVWSSMHCGHTLNGEFGKQHGDATNTEYIYFDLGAVYNLGSIRFMGRKDCCPEQSSDLLISVGTDLGDDGGVSNANCGAISETSGSYATHDCALSGRYVTFSHPGWIVMCSLEIYATVDVACSSYTCTSGYTLVDDAAEKICVGGVCDGSQCCKEILYCETFTCPEGMKHKSGYETILGETSDVCCDTKMCSDFDCTSDGAHIVGAASTAGDDFDTCCVCTFGTGVFYGAVAQGDYIINGESGDGTPTMSITLPIPSDITVSELTWYGGNGDGDYTSSDAKSWTMTEANGCKKQYKYVKTIPTFFESDAANWSIEGNALYSTITVAGTKTVTETFGSYTETYQRSIRHAIGVKVGLTTTSSVSANFYIAVPAGLEPYYFVTGIVDDFAADGSQVTLTMVVKTPDCATETATLAQGGDYVVPDSIEFGFGASSLDANDLCQQEVTFKFTPKTCFDSSQVFRLSLTTKTGTAFSVDMDVMIECASFLDDLPILATLTFHASQETLTTEQTTFHLGDEVYALLDTSTLVPLTNIEIEKVVIVQTGYSGSQVSTQLKPVEDEIYLYTDVYPAPNMGADTAMMMWDLESSHFTVSSSGSVAKTMVDFSVTYDSGYTFRRSLEVKTEFDESIRRVLDVDMSSKDPQLEQKEFGYSDEMTSDFTILDEAESKVGVQDTVINSPPPFGIYLVAAVLVVGVLKLFHYYQIQQDEKKAVLNMYYMEEDAF